MVMLMMVIMTMLFAKKTARGCYDPLTLCNYPRSAVSSSWTTSHSIQPGRNSTTGKAAVTNPMTQHISCSACRDYSVDCVEKNDPTTHRAWHIRSWGNLTKEVVRVAKIKVDDATKFCYSVGQLGKFAKTSDKTAVWSEPAAEIARCTYVNWETSSKPAFFYCLNSATINAVHLNFE